jgi:hypothetical protein
MTMMILMSFIIIPEANCHQFHITIIQLLQSAFFSIKLHQRAATGIAGMQTYTEIVSEIEML